MSIRFMKGIGIGWINCTFVYFLLIHQSTFKILGSPWLATLATSSIILLHGFMTKRRFDKRLAIFLAMIFASMPLFAFQIVVIDRLGDHIEFFGLYASFFLIGVALAYYTLSVNKGSEIYIVTLSLWLIINIGMLFILSDKGLLAVEANGASGFGGILVDRNNLAIQTVILMSLSMLTTKFKRSNYLLMILGSFLIVYTSSFTGILMLMGLITYLVSQLSLRRKVFFLSLTLPAVLYVTFYFDAALLKLLIKVESIVSFLTGVGPIIDGSIQSRLWLLDQGFSVWIENLFFGVGLNNTRLYIIKLGRFGEAGMNTHNNYLEWLVSTGLVGFILHYGLILYVYFFSKYNLKKNEVRLGLILYLICSVGSVAANHFLSVYIYIFAFLLYLNGKGYQPGV